MKAACYEANGAAADVLRLVDLPDPIPGPGEVRVRIHTSGVNPSDVKTRMGSTRPMAFPRVVPHSDGAGVIDAVGPGVDAGRVGQRVWVYNAAWGRPMGTAAEFVALPQEQAVPLPDRVDFAAAATFGIPAQTAHAAVFCRGDVAGRTVLVQGGAGAVGHYAIQFARWGGARVLATVSSEEKARVAQAAGAHETIDYRREDVTQRVRAATGGVGADMIIEVEFGANAAMDIEAVRPHGVIAVYGSAQRPTAELPVLPMMVKNIGVQFLIVYNLDAGQRARAVHDITALAQDGRLQAMIAQRHPLDRIVQAHLAQESMAVVGNIILEVR